MTQKKRDLLEEFARADWPEVRKKGKARYVWIDHVALYGVPIGILGIFWLFYLDGLSPRDLFSGRGAMLVYFVMASATLVSYGFGRLEWDKREEQFDRGTRDDVDDSI